MLARLGVAFLGKGTTIPCETRLDSHQHSGSERYPISRMAHCGYTAADRYLRFDQYLTASRREPSRLRMLLFNIRGRLAELCKGFDYPDHARRWAQPRGTGWKPSGEFAVVPPRQTSWQPLSMSELRQVVADLRAEGDELHEFLRPLDVHDWSLRTRFKDWTINDVIAHLYFGDHLGLTSHRSGDQFRAFMARVQESGLSLVEFTRRWLSDLSGPPLLQSWHEQFVTMCDLFAASDPDQRLTWAGPSMGIRMFATARLMETWAHSWAIYDRLGIAKPETDRIRHIVAIGTRTYGWTFANRSLAEPGPAPQLVLEAPSGARWEWHQPQQQNCIRGTAIEFCQVVTQVRNIADTGLEVVGEPARAWMAIAQCFAGPPEAPPAPGTRRRET